MQFRIFLLITLLTISTLAKVIIVQDPFFHDTKIKARRMKCDYYLDLRVLENANALYFKMKDVGLHKVWVSKRKLVKREGRRYLLESTEMENDQTRNFLTFVVQNLTK